MLRLIKFFLLGLVLLLVCVGSALLAMRFAIHGREVRVPQIQGLTPADAERLAGADGLVLSIDSRFYNADVPEGHIVSQAPAAGVKVRRGSKVRAAESLGSQRNSIPNVVGQSLRVAEMNITRRGHEVSSIATIHWPGAQPSSVVAQSPPGDTRNAVSPRVALLVAAPDNTRQYIMPSFVGHTLGSAIAAAEHEGFEVSSNDKTKTPSAIVVQQSPPAGQKIKAGMIISFETK